MHGVVYISFVEHYSIVLYIEIYIALLTA